jgi:hypothetical protein
LPPPSPPDISEIFPDEAISSAAVSANFDDYDLGDLTGVVNKPSLPPVTVAALPSLEFPEERMQSLVVDAQIFVKSCQGSEVLATAATERLQTLLITGKVALQVRQLSPVVTCQYYTRKDLRTCLHNAQTLRPAAQDPMISSSNAVNITMYA